MKTTQERLLWILISLSFIIRMFLAWSLEFGNDEVYYRLYALYPDWSHFDHPPMVGWVIQLFSLNLLFDTELGIRFAAVIMGTFNTYLIYRITSRIADASAGLLAAVLYTSSIYCFLIAGTFILPDSPQLLFWLLSLNLLMQILPLKEIAKEQDRKLLLAGLFIGLAMLSKYTSAFLWFGALLYIGLYNREWLKRRSLYISGIISLLVLTPAIYWNISNDFITFSYQGERVDVFAGGLNFNTFITEVVGQLFYNNPVNVVLILIALFAFRRNKYTDRSIFRIMMVTSGPIILIFIGFSLFRGTLPHWSGPGYLSLIILAAIYWSSKRKWLLSGGLPLFLSLAVMLIAYLQINQGIIKLDHEMNPRDMGRNDFSLDIYGWEQLGQQFADFRTSKDFESDYIISHRWFPAANYDFYVAKPNNMTVFGLGTLERIHKYAWINRERGGLFMGMDAWFITTSRDYADPKQLYSDYFTKIEFVGAIPIIRKGERVKFYHVFALYNLKKFPPNKLY